MCDRDRGLPKLKEVRCGDPRVGKELSLVGQCGWGDEEGRSLAVPVNTKSIEEEYECPVLNKEVPLKGRVCQEISCRYWN
jgi:hypothetical protein